MRYFFFLLSVLLVFAPFTRIHAFEFNPNNIISDFELKDKNSMSLSAIQAFLEKRQSPLKDLTFEANGVKKTAAEIIYEAAQTHVISPKFLLTMLDKEQCLIRGCEFHKDPQKLQGALNWAMSFATCATCDRNDPKAQKYKGFYQQVDAAAGVQNDYIRKAGTVSYIYKKGQTINTRDGFVVVPENQATANLYTYDPYHGVASGGFGGNYLFAKLWEEYWGHPLYPDGTILKDAEGTYWLIDGGAKRRYASEGVYLSTHTPEEAITASAVVVEEYPEGLPIKFANYSLVRDETGDTYLLVDGFKRKIQDQETLRVLGFNPEEIEGVAAGELAQYQPTVPVTKDEVYPQGVLLKEEGGETLYWVQNGFKYEVYADVAQINYARVKPVIVSKKEIAQYYPQTPKKLANGKLVKSRDGAFYFVSKEQLRPIPTMSDFIALFGEAKASLIYEVTEKTLALHDLGAPLQASAYERAGDTLKEESREDVVSYKALFVRADVPQTLVAHKAYTAAVVFKNKSERRWDGGEVTMQVQETEQTAANTDIVLADGDYVFKMPLLFDKEGKTTVTFRLYTKGGQYITGGLYQTEVVTVKPLYEAAIVRHTLPLALKDTWTRVAVEVRVKNVGSRPWNRRKTGLQFLPATEDGTSPFYDKSDWVNTKVASVSLKPFKQDIAPGEEAVFAFTLKPRSLVSGTYYYRLKLWMSDKEEAIPLNGEEFFKGMLRVDKG